MSERTKRPRFNGSVLCVTSAVLLLVASLSTWSLLTDSTVAGDLESGTHSAHTAAIGAFAFLCAVPGTATALAALARGPLGVRLVAIALLLIALPLVPTCGFFALLSIT